MVKVLYIAGWGRSGTTILDNILNSYESVFSVGELHHLWRFGLGGRRKCGCGERAASCPLWKKILRKAYGRNPPDAGETADLQHRVARVRHTRRLLSGPLAPDTVAYRDLVGRLYLAAAEVTGAQLIVDSSKVPSAAAMLAGMPGVEPYLVQVVRDPRAVAHSWMRPMMSPQGPVESTTSWLAWNWLVERVAGSYPGRYHRLRYESFVADPRATAETLLRFTGIAPEGGPFRDRKTVELATNHTVSGNPGRFRTGPVVIDPDEAWRSEQHTVPRIVSTALSLPLLHHYGYRIRTTGQ